MEQDAIKLNQQFINFKLIPGNAMISVICQVTYSGLISSTLSGFYQATYVHTDGSTKWVSYESR